LFFLRHFSYCEELKPNGQAASSYDLDGKEWNRWDMEKGIFTAEITS